MKIIQFAHITFCIISNHPDGTCRCNPPKWKTRLYPVYTISWLLVSPGHQQPWYWPCFPGLLPFQQTDCHFVHVWRVCTIPRPMASGLGLPAVCTIPRPMASELGLPVCSCPDALWLQKGSKISLNYSDGGGGIFRLLGSIPCLLMPWLLKSPGHQQAWYCQ